MLPVSATDARESPSRRSNPEANKARSTFRVVLRSTARIESSAGHPAPSASRLIPVLLSQRSMRRRRRRRRNSTAQAMPSATCRTAPLDSRIRRHRPRFPGRMSAAPPAPVERPLWLTVPGASAAVLLGWVVWLVLAALAPALVAASLGPAGAMLAVVTLGWWLARRAPEPGEALRRYHLDAAEVIAMGPGTAVRRLPWSEVVTLTEARHARVPGGRGPRLRLPLAAAVRSALLDRVAARLAAEPGALLDEGEAVRLGPATDPLPRALAWWVYVPALAAGLAGAGTAGLAVALVVA